MTTTKLNTPPALTKPILNCTLNGTHLTVLSKSKDYDALGHTVTKIKVKQHHLPGMGDKTKTVQVGIVPGITTNYNKPASFKVRHTEIVRLALPEHKVTEAGFDNYLGFIQLTIDNAPHLSTAIKQKLKKDLTSPYHVVAINKLTTVNKTTGHVCVWRPTTTIGAKKRELLVMVMTEVDGVKLEDMPDSTRSMCWDAAGGIATKGCYMTQAHIPATLQCDMVAKAKLNIQ